MPALRSLALAAATALVAALPLTPPTATSAAQGPDAAASAEAEGALAAVEALFDRSSARRSSPGTTRDGREATLLLRNLAAHLTDLGPGDRARAEGFLARPTDPDATVAPFRAATTPAPLCGPHVCVHYERGTSGAPPRKDTDGNGIPDQVDRTASVMERVWNSFTAAGYRPPLPDSGQGRQGPDRKLDVYLADTGRNFQYGMCRTDGPIVGRTAPVSCVLDNDFLEFPGDPLGNLRATAAHEFFHAVQYAYDVLEDDWFLEGTAAWVEDELYTAVNDNRQYLAASQMAVPQQSLDDPTDLSVYGSWIFWRYLTLRHPERTGGLPTIVRNLWERAGETPSDGRSFSMRALEQELAGRGSSLTTVFAGFAEANRHPAKHYDEGTAYLPSPVTDTFSLTKRRPRMTPVTVRLDHMSSRTWLLRPGTGMRGWKLRLGVDLPPSAHESAAMVTVVRARGMQHRRITLDAAGDGLLVVPFGTGKVRRVELTLVNAGRRYRCEVGTRFACRGAARDDRLRHSFTARTSR